MTYDFCSLVEHLFIMQPKLFPPIWDTSKNAVAYILIFYSEPYQWVILRLSE